MDGKQEPERASSATQCGGKGRCDAHLAETSVGDVAALLARVRPSGDGAALIGDGAALIGQLQDLEDVKSAAAGLLARIAVAFEARERRAQHAAGVPAAELGQGVAAQIGGCQIALARGESPARGNRLLGLAKALVTEMPHTLAALHTGQLNEWRATLLGKETACLSTADRCAVDEQLAADTGALAGLGDRALIAAARTASYRLDPHAVVNQASNATADRHVSLRPAPDTITYLTALLPAAAGVAVYAALTRHADTRRSTGDTRSRGQIMADDLVERVTEPARLPGYGIVPAAWARKPAFASPETNTGDDGEPAFTTWHRRLYTAPGSGELVAMDSRARIFPPGLRRFIHARDDTCRTPYCDAPIRHLDHIVPWHQNGPTSNSNGAGLCEACNHTKETPGWTVIRRPGPRHTIEINTPTGHNYQSSAPPLPGRAGDNTVMRRQDPCSRLQRRELLNSAKSLKRARHRHELAA